jgi:hypothetical protein
VEKQGARQVVLLSRSCVAPLLHCLSFCATQASYVHQIKQTTTWLPTNNRKRGKFGRGLSCSFVSVRARLCRVVSSHRAGGGVKRGMAHISNPFPLNDTLHATPTTKPLSAGAFCFLCVFLSPTPLSCSKRWFVLTFVFHFPFFDLNGFGRSYDAHRKKKTRIQSGEHTRARAEDGSHPFLTLLSFHKNKQTKSKS